jgi:nucleotide-binding universal stress UspA family protein
VAEEQLRRQHARAGATGRGTIVCGVDGREGGEQALAAAGRLAQRLQLSVVVAHVQLDGVPLGTPGLAVQELREDLEVEVLMQAAAALDPLGVPWRMALESGDPARGLQRIADRVGADLVVIGTRGAGAGCAVRRLVTGSVSSALVHHEHRPVLVVPPPRP